MLIFSLIKKEFYKAPLATVIAMGAFSISILGFLNEVTLFNLKSPSVIAVEEFVQLIKSDDKNRFQTVVRFENVGDIPASVKIAALMWDDSGNKINAGHEADSTPVMFDIYPRGENWIFAETDVFPSKLVVCITTQSMQGFGSGEFVGAYEANYKDDITSFRLADKAKLSSQISECQKVVL